MNRYTNYIISYYIIAQSFIELHKPLYHDKAVIHEGEWNIIQLQKEWSTDARLDECIDG